MATIVIPENVAVLDAGLYLDTLRDLWEHATLEEQKEICDSVLQSLYYDLRDKRITRLVPKPAFLPLFREIQGLTETEFGQFAVSAALRQGTTVAEGASEGA